MLTLGTILDNLTVKRAGVLGFQDELPVYVRTDAGLLEVSGVESGQVMTPDGPHDVLVLDVGSPAPAIDVEDSYAAV